VPRRPCRIAICGARTLFGHGGAELLVAGLRSELAARGHAVEVVSLPFTWAKGDLLQHVLSWRLITVEADLVVPTNFPSYFVKHDNKVVWLTHQHRKLYELYGTRFSEFGDDPQDDEVRAIISGADTRCLSEARRVFTISRNVSERLQKFNGISAEALYHPPPLHRSLACRDYGDFILMPTRLEAHKRPELFVEALGRSRSGVKGVIVGTGPMEAELGRRIRELGLEARVRMTGSVDDATLVDLYASCAAVFYAPFDEDYGYVTLEAFGARKPVITAVDSGGILEFVADGETGCVVAPDATAAARAIDQLVETPPLARRLGEAGHERVRHVSWEGVIERLIAD
jgi:glycosyltransferase involved in cell wall biosynthesis